MDKREQKGERVIRALETPLVYSLTGISVLVSILVYGSTLIRGSGGLFRQLRPMFGIPYVALLFVALVTILVLNGRWKCLVVIALGETVHFLAVASPQGVMFLEWEEYLTSSATIACLLVTACIYYQLIDES